MLIDEVTRVARITVVPSASRVSTGSGSGAEGPDDCAAAGAAAASASSQTRLRARARRDKGTVVTVVGPLQRPFDGVAFERAKEMVEPLAFRTAGWPGRHFPFDRVAVHGAFNRKFPRIDDHLAGDLVAVLGHDPLFVHDATRTPRCGVMLDVHIPRASHPGRVLCRGARAGDDDECHDEERARGCFFHGISSLTNWSGTQH